MINWLVAKSFIVDAYKIFNLRKRSFGIWILREATFLNSATGMSSVSKSLVKQKLVFDRNYSENNNPW